MAPGVVWGEGAGSLCDPGVCLPGAEYLVSGNEEPCLRGELCEIRLFTGRVWDCCLAQQRGTEYTEILVAASHSWRLSQIDGDPKTRLSPSALAAAQHPLGFTAMATGWCRGMKDRAQRQLQQGSD